MYTDSADTIQPNQSIDKKDYSMIQPELRMWFRERFFALRLSQEKFSERYDISRAVISSMISDTSNRKIGIAVLIKLSAAFNYPLINLLEMAGFAPKSEPATAAERHVLFGYRRLDARDQQTLMIFLESLQKLERRRSAELYDEMRKSAPQ